MATLVAAAIGLLVGPWLRLAIDQVPPRRPLLRRRGPDDGPAVAPRSLVPVLSWWLAGSPGTVAPVGSPDEAPDGGRETVVRRWRAPAVDLATAVVLGALGYHVDWSADLPAALVFGAAIVVVAVIDIDHYRIPDRVVFPTLAASIVLLAGAAAAEDVPRALVGALSGAVAYFVFLLAFFLVSPSGMGFGDVKLALLLGLHLGWMGSIARTAGGVEHTSTVEALQLVLVGGLFGSVIGSVVGLGALALRGRRAHFPFGPSLCLGALVAVLASEQFPL